MQVMSNYLFAQGGFHDIKNGAISMKSREKNR